MTTLLPPTQADLCAALLDPAAACPCGLQAWNGSDPEKRLAVYRNNVAGSLTEALADTFPVVHALVGGDFFRAMAGVFVRQNPPRSRLLVHYGQGFAEFLESFEPAGSVPYLADVARLEMARVEAFHAADAAPPLPSAASAALASGERIGELRLGVHPSVRLVPSRYAIVSIWAAHQGQGDLATVDPGYGESALVLRPQFDVLVLRCDPGTARFVLCLQRGCALAESAATAAADALDFDLPATLSLLMTHGALTSIDLPDGPTS
ncbi:MAG: putative DNA-binding domain-containing protein [Ramlibacter sp.]|nr:putative DNA-binding domain-containing protein [Ramlibacter sp.]